MRRIDEIGAKNYKSFKERFVLVSDVKIKSWKFFFIVAFIVGMITTTIWGYTTGKFNESSAFSLGSLNPVKVVKHGLNDPKSVVNPASVVTGVPMPDQVSPSTDDVKDAIDSAPLKDEIKDATIASAVVVASADPIVATTVSGTAAAVSPVVTKEVASDSIWNIDDSSSNSVNQTTQNTSNPTTVTQTATNNTTAPVSESTNVTTAPTTTNTAVTTDYRTAQTPSSNTPITTYSQAASQNNTPTTPTSSVTTSAATTSKTTSKKPVVKEGIKIENSKNIVQRGDILVQSGDNFSKNSKVNLYFQLANGKFSVAHPVKTNSEGKFETTYKVAKPNGTYKWYAYDVYSRKTSKVITYTVR